MHHLQQIQIMHGLRQILVGDSTSDVVFSASSSATTNITYNAAGTYNIIMTVSDNSNYYSTLSSTIQVTVS